MGRLGGDEESRQQIAEHLKEHVGEEIGSPKGDFGRDFMATPVRLGHLSFLSTSILDAFRMAEL